MFICALRDLDSCHDEQRAANKLSVDVGRGPSMHIEGLLAVLASALRRIPDPAEATQRVLELVRSRRALALMITFEVRRYRKLVSFGCKPSSPPSK